jgi:putative transferase (TIGR04331 family)
LLSAEAYENKLSHRYYTWGWGNYVLPHPKLLKKKLKIKEKIVLTFPSVPIYCGVLEDFPTSTQFAQICRLTDLFLEKLNSGIRSRVFLRQITRDCLRQYKRNGVLPDTTLDFPTSLMESKVHVSNHLGTPFLESLASNRPTLVFYDSTISALRRNARPYFDKLKKVKILFDDPVDAANHLNSIYYSIDDWWLSGEVQEAVNEFRDRFARTDPNWMDKWVTELLK